MKTFFKYIVAAALVLSSVWASSAQVRIPLLDKVPGHRVTFDYKYSVSVNGEAMNEVTSGKVVVEGNCFDLSGLGLRIVSDGSTRWTVDLSEKEVLVETVDSGDFVTNPALLISSYTKLGDKVKVNSSGPDSLDLTVRLDTDVTARFILKHVVFSDLVGNPSAFILDVNSLGSDYIVTDLR